MVVAECILSDEADFMAIRPSITMKKILNRSSEVAYQINKDVNEKALV